MSLTEEDKKWIKGTIKEYAVSPWIWFMLWLILFMSCDSSTIRLKHKHGSVVVSGSNLTIEE